MIVKLSAPTGLRFTGASLPEAVQDLALRHAVVARVVSLSMHPTLCPDDRLDIAPAEPVCLGDLVVYRRPGGLVCHRVVEIDADRLTTRGDAEAGPLDHITREDVIGKVVAVERGSTRLATDALEQPALSTADASHQQSASFSARMRYHSVCVIRTLLSRPRIGPVLSYWIVRLCAADPIVQPGIHIFAQAIAQSSDAPSRQLSSDRRRAIPLPCLVRFGPIRLGVIEKSGAVMLRPALADTTLESALQRIIRTVPLTTQTGQDSA